MSNPKPDLLVDIYDEDGKLEHHAVSLLEAMGGDPESFAQARSDIERDGEHCGGGGAAPFYRIVPSGATPMTVLPPCRFSFDDATEYQGYSHASTWNGFDNVAVTRATLDQIIADVERDAPQWDANVGDTVAGFREIEPFEAQTVDGAMTLYSLGWGYATSIVERDRK